MVSFTSLISAAAAVASVAASTGTNNGFYYSNWAQNSAGVDYENGAAGEYSVTWDTSAENFVCGKGWATGSDRNIAFDADFSPENNGNAYLSVYGWTTSPLIEYYIVENLGEYNPGSAGTYKGTVESDGSTYKIYTAERTNAASIQGTTSFTQFWSIRDNTRSSGTVTTSNHFDTWASLGMTMGSFGSGAYQIVATEGYESAGSSTVTVSEA